MKERSGGESEEEEENGLAIWGLRKVIKDRKRGQIVAHIELREEQETMRPRCDGCCVSLSVSYVCLCLSHRAAQGTRDHASSL